MLDFVTNELKNVAIDFYTLTGIQIVLYNSEKKMIFSYPEKLSPFCKQVRSDQRLFDKCMHCDTLGLNACEKTRAPFIYHCHMNLFETVAPICENNTTIGYLMTGQMVDASEIEKTQELCKTTAEQYHLDYPSLSEKLKLLPQKNQEYILATVKMLSMCIFYLYFNNIIYNKTDILSYQIKEYIQMHLSEPLSIESLCNQFYISRSTLYSLSTHFSGMGITDYIRNQRMEKAKQLLITTNEPIRSIVEEVGFHDANYFSRIFKATQKMTPKMFRNLNKGA